MRQHAKAFASSAAAGVERVGQTMNTGSGSSTFTMSLPAGVGVGDTCIFAVMHTTSTALTINSTTTTSGYEWCFRPFSWTFGRGICGEFKVSAADVAAGQISFGVSSGQLSIGALVAYRGAAVTLLKGGIGTSLSGTNQSGSFGTTRLDKTTNCKKFVALAFAFNNSNASSCTLTAGSPFTSVSDASFTGGLIRVADADASAIITSSTSWTCFSPNNFTRFFVLIWEITEIPFTTFVRGDLMRDAVNITVENNGGVWSTRLPEGLTNLTVHGITPGGPGSVFHDDEIGQLHTGGRGGAWGLSAATSSFGSNKFLIGNLGGAGDAKVTLHTTPNAEGSTVLLDLRREFASGTYASRNAGGAGFSGGTGAAPGGGAGNVNGAGSNATSSTNGGAAGVGAMPAGAGANTPTPNDYGGGGYAESGGGYPGGLGLIYIAAS